MTLLPFPSADGPCGELNNYSRRGTERTTDSALTERAGCKQHDLGTVTFARVRAVLGVGMSPNPRQHGSTFLQIRVAYSPSSNAVPAVPSLGRGAGCSLPYWRGTRLQFIWRFVRAARTLFSPLRIKPRKQPRCGLSRSLAILSSVLRHVQQHDRRNERDVVQVGQG